MSSDREVHVSESPPSPSEAATPPAAPPEPVEPPQSRFLFVNIAAQRAKQLRRGALPRLPELRRDPATGAPPATNTDHKPERVAIEEVARGLVPYTLPEPPTSRGEGGRP
jgi:DNA-directed RNA polymerase subunit K/omega